MKLKRLSVVLIIGSLIFCSIFTNKVYAAINPSISMEHSTICPIAGQYIQTKIKVKDIYGFAGYQVRIKYDKTLLEPYVQYNDSAIYTGNYEPMDNYTKPNPGDILLHSRECKKSDFIPVSIAKNDISNGILNFGRYYIKASAYKSSGISESTGTIAVIYFKVLKNSVNPLTSISFENSSTTTTGPITGDLNGDNAVNMTDVVEVSKYFNTLNTDPNYKKEYDINLDNAINMIEIMIIASKFNTISNSINGTCLYNWDALQVKEYSVYQKENQAYDFWTWNTGNKVLADKGRHWFEDVDGDGRKDLIGIGASGTVDAGWVYVALNNGTEFNFWSWNSGGQVISDNSHIWHEDVDGDGRKDLIGQGAAGTPTAGWVYVAHNNKTGFDFWSWNSGVRVLGDQGRHWFEDVDGDGRKDLIGIGAPGTVDAGWVYVGHNNGTGFDFWTWNSGRQVISDNSPIWFEDVDGDGKKDLIGQGAAGTPTAGWVYVALNNGTGFNFWSWNTGRLVIADNSPIWFEDVNGDGRKDLIGQGASGNSDAGWLYVALNNGKGFDFWTWHTRQRVMADNGKYWFEDVNGDGRKDLIRQGEPGTAYAGWVYVANCSW
ncbi:FG-GAP-like repeat-containing protein [Pseudobacteroides cellulosolvens]|uniref:FG-GAP-like repeat-containing protein n=1 Tax=Pseudobacteroides cellulosolvens TaxID=35825 RepID=UPI00056008C3|nr:FG-GAP-like repeat-containing protein [Pseudobacteroides cellulosolvens]